MATRSRRGQNHRTDYGELVEVARLYFRSGATQTEIADALSIPQARVSRLLRQAEDEEIVQHVIFPPPLNRLKSAMMRRFEAKGVREVRVVPRGVGASADKNEENLGAITAEYLVDALVDHSGDTVSVCMACGNTLLSVITHFMERLRRQPSVLEELKRKTIVLYPLSLYWEPTLRFHIDTEYPSTSIYPSALVVYLAMRLMTLGCKVIAHAPQPPLDFYRELDSMSDDERVRQVTKYKDYLEGAKAADIFVLGIGTGQHDLRYRRVLDDLAIELTNERGMAGEIGYQPFDSDGQFVDFSKLIAVTGDELSKVSQGSTKVIAAAGGAGKTAAIEALLNRDRLPFNVFVTDEAIAEQLDGQSDALLGNVW
ncbi:MAG: sugar-binding domain-containing protein [SAR202 cluster bacterium]|nr:sugar-binding domain-containing protein [SAR202 cluster bacterium]MDP6301076.1 sugar-binding domain-containing protein [SAR202 cluster bacterium]MDP7104077.1 sugar-binding domain-containing protein [SAR202 cluster bacterium]MDP7225689.1 sugar-binding domain-containing protein [SAR202 cluster bacterium]MDP7414625.1 sugar-binding domain-containing protein [SAR202 cluster bacterium]